MGANVKDLKMRIKSVTSTHQLTKAMGLVASSKIRRANISMQKSKKYFEAIENAKNALSASVECQRSRYMNASGDKTLIIVIAGDRGLAGGYNANVFRLAKTMDAEFLPIGKRANEKFGNGYASSEHFSAVDAKNLAKELTKRFLAGEFDKLGIIYTKYVSVMTQEAQVKWVLPIEKAEDKAVSVIFEPDEKSVLEILAEEYVSGSIIACVRESFASEVAARRVAMDAAGKNAKAMIDDLQLKYNHARQGAITQEITEIVAGSGN